MEEAVLPGLVLSSDSESEPSTDNEEEEETTTTTTTTKKKKKKKRAMCFDGCGRPSSVCICPHLPPQPIPTSTQLFILHHPHELRHNKLATLPALTRSLLNSHSLPGRRLRLGISPLLDSLYYHSPPSSSNALFLFPSGDDSTDLSRWASETPPSSRTNPVLIVFDGTWKQAKEMVAASLPFLSRFARQVSLGSCDVRVEGDSTFESDLVLKKEPFLVARSLRILEPDSVGVEADRRLLQVLRAMVAFQACHLKPVKHRPKLSKEKKEKKSTMKENVD